MNHKTYFLLFYLIKYIQTIYDSFMNECGPYNNTENESIIPTRNNCINESANAHNKTCCFLEGEKDLKYRTACVLINDTQEERISLLKEMKEVATKLKIDCGNEKNLTSDCGPKDPSSVRECEFDKSKQCCFVKIKSEDFNGSACKRFKNMTRTKIGQTVIAAKTVGATLEIACYCRKFFDINYFLLIIYILFLFI